MVDLASSPQRAPAYAHVRQVKEAADTLPETNRAHGVNAAEYRHVHIQVCPSTLANPALAILVWSEKLGKFVATNAATTKAGAGAGVPYEFTFDPMGRIFFIAVTGGIAPGDTVDILVSGYDAVGTA
jgi:hypothetical protein